MPTSHPPTGPASSSGTDHEPSLPPPAPRPASDEHSTPGTDGQEPGNPEPGNPEPVSFVPFLGGPPGAAGSALVFGAAGGFGNVIIVTLLQRWAPAHLLGQVMSLMMLASIGTFPASAALSGVIVHSIGPAPFFPAAGAILALSVFPAATIREFRDFGVTAGPITDQAAVVTAR